MISQEAVNFIREKVYNGDPTTWMPETFITSSPSTAPKNKYEVDIEHFCAPIIHPVTGETITKYHKLIKDPQTKDIWSLAFGKKFGNLAQGDEVTGTEGTHSVFFMSHDDIKSIPSDRVVTYARIVVNFCPQKKDPNRVRITAGGNLIDYPGELTTRSVDLTTSKILWNSVLITKDAKFMGIDISNFYLGTPMDGYEYENATCFIP